MDKAMIVAVASNGVEGLEATVAGHFGRCAAYTFITVDGDSIVETRPVANPFAGGHKPGQLPEWIQEEGAHVILAGGMGRRAVDLFSASGIAVATGATGRIEDAVRAYVSGSLKGTTPCAHGGDCGDGEGGGHHHHH